MNKGIFRVTIFLVFLTSQNAAAQRFFFSGLGRALVTTDRVEFNQRDTVSPNVGASGYFLFDMGFNYQKDDFLRVNAILRTKAQFGTFFGRGTGLLFRQFQIDGVAAKVIKYSIGDINLEMSPYTVFNNYENFHTYEAEVFKIRRSIVNYENFNFGNQWRVQGGKAAVNFKLSKVLQSGNFNAFVTRSRPSDDLNIRDRLLLGAGLNLVQSKFFELGGKIVRFYDIPGQQGPIEYNNNVYTSDAKLKLENDKISIVTAAEAGISSYDFSRTDKDTSVAYDDFFYDVKLSGEHRPTKIKVSVNYRNVGPQFSSPSAQTLRINQYGNPAIFNKIDNNRVFRNQTLFDRLSEEGLYNQGISPVLMPFLPQYNNVLPYGLATPNRRGWTAQLGSESIYDYVDFSARVDVLTEIIGEGTTALRNFQMLQAGTFIHLNKLFKLERNLSVNFGTKMEKTMREGLKGVSPVNLNSTLLDAGLTWEAAKNFDILIGMKTLTSKGNEFIGMRDQFNLLQSFNEQPIDLKEQIYSAGVRYSFSENSFLTLSGNYIENERNIEKRLNYKWRQIFLNYTVQF